MYKRATRRSRLLLSAHLTAAIFLMSGAVQATDGGAHFVYVSESGGTLTDLIHPLIDDQPNAIFHVTQNWNPPGTPGTYNDHVIGIQFNVDLGWWAIYNQDISGQLLGAGFNIWIPPAGASSFVHTANAGNITNNWTVIDSPLTNNNPDAILRVTQNSNPGGGAVVMNDHVIGVWYTGSRWAIFNQDLVAMPVDASFNVSVLPDDPTVFVHTATAGNIIGNWTIIDHPLTNNNPNAIVSITQNWNPGGTGEIYNDHVVGVWYHDGLEKWAIFNQDGITMPTGASFNVSSPARESALFVHSADAGNTVGSTTEIDNPLANSNPNATVFITQSWNPGGAGGVFNDHTLGVLYNGSGWAIFNQDSGAMPVGASFNVSIPASDASTFVHSATDWNTSGNSTTIDNPVINGNPDAIVHVAQNWNPSGVGGVGNDHVYGVFYDGANWAIFNQDHLGILEGAAFNVLIPAVDAATFVHTATVGNITNNWTAIDNPITNGHPDVIVQVTQNWNPPGSSGI